MHTQKNINKSEKKPYGGSKLIYENNFTIKKPRKNRNFPISMLYYDPFPRHDFFLWFV